MRRIHRAVHRHLEKALGICDKRSEVGHCTNAHEYKRWINSERYAEIEDIDESAVVEYFLKYS